MNLNCWNALPVELCTLCLDFCVDYIDEEQSHDFMLDFLPMMDGLTYIFVILFHFCCDKKFEFSCIIGNFRFKTCHPVKSSLKLW